MSVRTFVCKNQACRHYKLTKLVSVGLDCTRIECEGLAVLRGARTSEPPFWQQPAFLGKATLLFCLAFISYAFLRPLPSTTQDASPIFKPPLEVGVIPPLPNPPLTQTPPKLVVNNEVDVQFQVDLAIACMERLTRYQLALEIARAAAEGKALNKPTEIGRTSDQRYDQLQLNFEGYQEFHARVSEHENKINLEISTYMQILTNLHTFPNDAVEAAFETARKRYETRPKSTMIPPKLSWRHWKGNSTLIQIRSDIEHPETAADLQP